ncbi:MAG: RDD family protein [Candidatus Cloacimonetes bacterium]|nr:RDD family protein [Candidatus Cloacimonadota bacterium]
MYKYSLAGHGRRLAAYVLDTLILTVILYYPLYLWITANYPELLLIKVLPVFIIVMGVLFVWHTVFWKLLGGTPGQLLLGLQVVNARTGKRSTMVFLFLRFITDVVSHAGLLIGLLWSLWDSRKQTWHDKICGTVVVKREMQAETEEQIAELFPVKSSERDHRYWKTGKVLIIITMLALVLIKIAFLYDERLEPEAKSWLQENYADSAKPSDNAFYYLLGFAAGKDENAFTVGYQKRQDCVAALLEQKTNMFVEGEPLLSPDSLFAEEINDLVLSIFLGDHTTQSLIMFYNELRNAYDEYDYLQERYEALGTQPEYKNTLPAHPQTNSPYIVNVIMYQALYLLNIGLDYLEGDTEEALSRLEADYQRWNDLYPKIGFLINKLGVTIMIQRDLSMYDRLLEIDALPDRILHYSLLELSEMTPEQRSFEKTTEYEFLYTAGNILPFFAGRIPTFLENPLRLNPRLINASRSYGIFKPCHYLNWRYRNLAALSRSSRINAQQYLMETTSGEPAQAGTLSFLLDPFGTVLILSEQDVYSRYLLKTFDINGKLRLLKMKSLLRTEEIAEEDISDFLVEQEDKYFNPYTGEAFMYDEEAGTIYYEGPLQEDNEGTRKVTVRF